MEQNLTEKDYTYICETLRQRLVLCTHCVEKILIQQLLDKVIGLKKEIFEKP